MSSLIDSCNFPHRCTAKRRSSSQDNLGGETPAFPTTIFSERPCWRQKLSDNEINYWMMRDVAITNKVFFETDPQIGADTALFFDDSPNYFYDVQSYAEPDDSAGLGLLYRVTVNRVPLRGAP